MRGRRSFFPALVVLPELLNGGWFFLGVSFFSRGPGIELREGRMINSAIGQPHTADDAKKAGISPGACFSFNNIYSTFPFLVKCHRFWFVQRRAASWAREREWWLIVLVGEWTHFFFCVWILMLLGSQYLLPMEQLGFGGASIVRGRWRRRVEESHVRRAPGLCRHTRGYSTD